MYCLSCTFVYNPLSSFHFNSANHFDESACCSIALALSKLPSLQHLVLDDKVTAADCIRSGHWQRAGLVVPPDEVVSQDWLDVVQYLARSDKVPVHKIRFFVVGDSTMGKTSLVLALKNSSGNTACSIEEADRTVGIDVHRVMLAGGGGADIDAALWDMAGQDVYTLSHAVHFTDRCIYLLLWKPDAGAEPVATVAHIHKWLETLSMHVPNAVVVLVGSHCESLPGVDYAGVAAAVEASVKGKVMQLNECTQLEVEELRQQYKDAKEQREAAVRAYKAACAGKDRYRTAEDAFLRSANEHHFFDDRNFLHRSLESSGLPRSLRQLARAAADAQQRSSTLRERLQVLLGLRDGSEPLDDQAAAAMTSHFFVVDSRRGTGIANLRARLHEVGFACSLVTLMCVVDVFCCRCA